MLSRPAALYLMGNTFVEAKARLAKNVLRDDLADSYGDFINQAIREIENRRSWLFMKNTVTVTLAAGDQTVTAALPADFKELQKRPAVHFITDGDNQLIPAEVVFEEQQIQRVWAFGGNPIVTWPPRVYVERSATGAVLGMLEPRIESFNFRIKHFRYLPDLAADGDVSPFYAAYPMMVLAKAKQIAFDSINDPIEAQAEMLFEKKFAEATRQDAYSEVAGRELRM